MNIHLIPVAFFRNRISMRVARTWMVEWEGMISCRNLLTQNVLGTLSSGVRKLILNWSERVSAEN